MNRRVHKLLNRRQTLAVKAPTDVYSIGGRGETSRDSDCCSSIESCLVSWSLERDMIVDWAVAPGVRPKI